MKHGELEEEDSLSYWNALPDSGMIYPTNIFGLHRIFKKWLL